MAQASTTAAGGVEEDSPRSIVQPQLLQGVKVDPPNFTSDGLAVVEPHDGDAPVLALGFGAEAKPPMLTDKHIPTAALNQLPRPQGAPRETKEMSMAELRAQRPAASTVAAFDELHPHRNVKAKHDRDVQLARHRQAAAAMAARHSKPHHAQQHQHQHQHQHQQQPQPPRRQHVRHTTAHARHVVVGAVEAQPVRNSLRRADSVRDAQQAAMNRIQLQQRRQEERAHTHHGPTSRRAADAVRAGRARRYNTDNVTTTTSGRRLVAAARGISGPSPPYADNHRGRSSHHHHRHRRHRHSRHRRR